MAIRKTIGNDFFCFLGDDESSWANTNTHIPITGQAIKNIVSLSVQVCSFQQGSEEGVRSQPGTVVIGSPKETHRGLH